MNALTSIFTAASVAPPIFSFVLGFWRRISESFEQVWAGALKGGFDLSLSGLIHLSLSHPAVALWRYLIVIPEGRLSPELICRETRLLHWLYRGRGAHSLLHLRYYLTVVGGKKKQPQAFIGSLILETNENNKAAGLKTCCNELVHQQTDDHIFK